MSLHPESARLRRAIARCSAHVATYTGVVYRSAAPHYANKDDLLTGLGSKIAGARWNPPDSFPTVYSSWEPETALAEVLAHFRYYGLPIAKVMPRVIVSIEVKLQKVIDLTDGGVRTVLGVSSKRMLSEPWRELQKRGREALTQAIGRIANDAGLEGILVPSAAHASGINLIIFPANVEVPKSWLRIINEDDLPLRR